MAQPEHTENDKCGKCEGIGKIPGALGHVPVISISGLAAGTSEPLKNAFGVSR
jgi:hypothetical protein